MQIRNLFLKPTSSCDGVRLRGFGPGLNVVVTPDNQDRARLLRYLCGELTGNGSRVDVERDGPLEIAWHATSEYGDPASDVPEVGSVPKTTVDSVHTIPQSLFWWGSQSASRMTTSLLSHPWVVQELVARADSRWVAAGQFETGSPLAELSNRRSLEARLLKLYVERRGLQSRIRSVVESWQRLQQRLRRMRMRSHELETCWRRAESQDSVIRRCSDAASSVAGGPPHVTDQEPLSRWRNRLRLIRQLRTRIEQLRAQSDSVRQTPEGSIDGLRRQLSQLRALRGSAPPGHHAGENPAETSRIADKIDRLLRQFQAHVRAHQLDEFARDVLPVEEYARHAVQRLLRDAAAACRGRQRSDSTQWCRQELAILNKRSAEIEQRLRCSPQFLELVGLRLKLLDVERRLAQTHKSRWLASDRRQALGPTDRVLWSIGLWHDMLDRWDQRMRLQPVLLDEPLVETDRVCVNTVVQGLSQFTDSDLQILYFTSRYEVANLLGQGGARILAWQSVDPSTENRDRPAAAHPQPPRTNRPEAASPGRAESTSKSSAITIGDRTRRGQMCRSMHYLSLSSSISDCPSIDSRLANQFAELGIETVRELLDLGPDEFALEAPHLGLGPIALFSIQLQARLMCQIPMLDQRAARFLVRCGVTSPRQLGEQSPSHLLRQVSAVMTEQGWDTVRAPTARQVVLRETAAWIRRARRSRSLWDLQHNPLEGGLAVATRARSGLGRSVTRGFLPLTGSASKGYPTQTALIKSSSPIDRIPGIKLEHVQRIRRLDIHTAQQFIYADSAWIARSCAEWSCSQDLVESWQRIAVLACQLPG
ncbi:MAG: DUF4332 domain-containing protein, partial [Planctomycetaceae bacterium]